MYRFGNPGLFPVPADAHVAGVVRGPLVVTRPGAPLDGEAFVYVLEVVAHVPCIAADFLGLLGTCVGEVAVRVGLAVTLEDARKGAVLCTVVIATAIVYAIVVRQWLLKKAGRSVKIKVPKIGENAKLIRMIKANAKKEHSERELKIMRDINFKNTAVSTLADILARYHCGNNRANVEVELPSLHIGPYDYNYNRSY